MKTKNSKDPPVKLFDRSIDLCKILAKPKKSDIVASYMNKVLSKNKDPMGQCPIKKGDHYLKNVSFGEIEIPFASVLLGTNNLYDKIITYNNVFLTKDNKKNYVPVINLTFVCSVKAN